MKKLLAFAAILLLGACSPQVEEVRYIKGDKGDKGDSGIDGISCSSERQEEQKRVKIVCTKDNLTVSTSYVYDGQAGSVGDTGDAGKSCTATAVSGGINVKCGDDVPVFLADGEDGEDGSPGINGINGTNGTNGMNGLDAFTPGLLCDVYNSQSIDRLSNASSLNSSSNIVVLLKNAVPKFTKVINQLDVGDTPSVNGFPKFTSTEQPLIGYEDYAIDCNGYLNVPQTGFYNLYLFSDDGSRLALNGSELINHDGLHSPTEKSATNVLLYKGPNKINVMYYQGPHSQIALKLDWSGPQFSRQLVNSSKLTH